MIGGTDLSVQEESEKNRKVNRPSCTNQYGDEVDRARRFGCIPQKRRLEGRLAGLTPYDSLAI